MKKMGDIMNELGFNAEASEASKEAFIKYLIKQSTGIIVQTPSEKMEIQKFPEKIVELPEQMTFDFIEKKHA